MLARFGCDPENGKHLLVELSDANSTVLFISCLTIDNRYLLGDCRNSSQFIAKNDINVFLLQDTEVAIRGGFGRKRLVTQP